MDPLESWIGRTETRSDVLTAAPAAALSATLDRGDPMPSAGDPLPPLWHWLYFLPLARNSELGQDGHAQRGGFLPPVPLPRRMWAGGAVEFHHPLRIGEAVQRESRITAVRAKQGRSGPLVFVTIRHELRTPGGLALVEDQEIVYRGRGSAPPHTEPAPAEAPWERLIAPGETLLFRYSALTFNAHRIHYDRRYAVEVEGYPGLVVQAPLIATLLADLVRRGQPEAEMLRFRFRAIAPLFDTAPFRVCGRPENRTVALWAERPDRTIAVSAACELY